MAKIMLKPTETESEPVFLVGGWQQAVVTGIPNGATVKLQCEQLPHGSDVWSDTGTTFGVGGTLANDLYVFLACPDYRYRMVATAAGATGSVGNITHQKDAAQGLQ